MTGPDPRSGRRSGRVPPPQPQYAPDRRLEADRAPESINSPAEPGGGPPDARAQRVSRRQLALTAAELSDRDRAIVADLARFRFLSTRQLERLHFADHASPIASGRICRRVLERLAGLRVIEHLARRIGGVRAGSAAYIWRVGVVGDRLLRQAAGEGSRARHKEPSTRFVDHCLAVADCYLTLVELDRQRLLELLTAEPEPACWRRYLGTGGQPEMLKPDLFAVSANGEFEDHWFIEVDRGTESLPTLLRKCGQYEHYRRTGREQADGGVFPLVLWLVPDEIRAAKLRAGRGAARRLDASLFRIAVTAERAEMFLTGGGA